MCRAKESVLAIGRIGTALVRRRADAFSGGRVTHIDGAGIAVTAFGVALAAPASNGLVDALVLHALVQRAWIVVVAAEGAAIGDGGPLAFGRRGVGIESAARDAHVGGAIVTVIAVGVAITTGVGIGVPNGVEDGPLHWAVAELIGLANVGRAGVSAGCTCVELITAPRELRPRLIAETIDTGGNCT